MDTTVVPWNGFNPGHSSEDDFDFEISCGSTGLPGPIHISATGVGTLISRPGFRRCLFPNKVLFAIEVFLIDNSAVGV